MRVRAATFPQFHALRSASTPPVKPEAEKVPIDLVTATKVTETSMFRPLWKAPLEHGFFFSSERYGGPAPVFSNDGSVLVGDTRSYQMLNRDTGASPWKVELPEDEEFKSGDPVVAGRSGELVCLRYNRRTGPGTSKDGFCGIDTRTGKVRFKTTGDHPITGAQADPAGNLYYGTITGKIMRVSPEGVETQLNRPEGWQPNVLGLQVREDGSVVYARPASPTLRILDGLEEKKMELEGRLSYPDSFKLTGDGGVLCLTQKPQPRPEGAEKDPPEKQILTRLGPSGDVLWSRPAGVGYSKFAVRPDGSAVVLKPGGRDKPAVLQEIAPNGSDGWDFILDDPELHSGNWWSTGWMNIRDDGSVLLIEPDRAIVLCLDPQGQEKWRRLPEPFPQDAYWPAFSTSRDGHLFIVNRGGLEKLDLETGKKRYEYSPQKGGLTRYREGQAPTRIPIPQSDPFAFAGNVVEDAGGDLYCVSRDCQFSRVRMPGSASQMVEDAMSRVRSEESAPTIRRLDGYVSVGGVMVPRRKAAS